MGGDKNNERIKIWQRVCYIYRCFFTSSSYIGGEKSNDEFKTQVGDKKEK
jgi:hypothetical protein